MKQTPQIPTTDQPSESANPASASQAGKSRKPLGVLPNLVALSYCSGVVAINFSKYGISGDVIAFSLGEILIPLVAVVLYNTTKWPAKVYGYLVIGIVAFELLCRLGVIKF